MIQPLASPRSTAALLDLPSDTLRPVTCPSCHTTHGSLTQEALKAGGVWVCVRCGQGWDADRLETVAAYTAWIAENDRR